MVSFHQRNLSVIDYARKCDELTITCGVVECEPMTIARFKCGLRSEIQKKMSTLQYSDLQEIFDTTLMWETIKGALGSSYKVKESARF